MEAFDGSFFDGPIHSLNLAISPGMLNLGEAMSNAMFSADAAKNVIASVPIAGTVRKLDTVIGQYRMEGVWHYLDQIAQELCSNHLAGLGMEFGHWPQTDRACLRLFAPRQCRRESSRWGRS